MTLSLCIYVLYGRIYQRTNIEYKCSVSVAKNISFSESVNNDKIGFITANKVVKKLHKKNNI